MESQLSPISCCIIFTVHLNTYDYFEQIANNIQDVVTVEVYVPSRVFGPYFVTKRLESYSIYIAYNDIGKNNNSGDN